jgi:hypothetical protein
MIQHLLSLSPKTNSAGQAYSSASYQHTGARVKTNTYHSSVNDQTAKMDNRGPYPQSNSYGMRPIPSGNPAINAFTVITRRKQNASSNKKYQPKYAFYTIADRNACPIPPSYFIPNYQPSSKNPPLSNSKIG